MTLSKKEQETLLQLQNEEEEYYKYNKAKIFYSSRDYNTPDGKTIYSIDKYERFQEFYAAGKTYKRRGIVAANRVGKTLRALSELVFHATLDYPDDWVGYKYNRPLRIFIGCDRGSTAKSVFNLILLDDKVDDPQGLIPKSSLLTTVPLQGTPGGVGEYKIKNKKGISTIQVGTYNSGRNAFEGSKYDIVYLDEEAPRDILSEAALRTMGVKDSMIISTFTPDSGLSDTYLYFADKDNADQVSTINITWDDVPHLDEQEKKDMLKTLTPQERECRSKGIPYLGKGKIYQFTEESFVVPPLQKIPRYWPRVFSMDVGYSHPTAVLWGAWDRESDILYIYSEYKVSEAPPSTHANAIIGRGSWIPGIIDTSANNASQSDGTRLITIYEKFGLDLHFVKKGAGSVEEGILEVSDRIESGRLKIFESCRALIDEYRKYRRDDNGKIVKKDDDLMDALRYMIRSGLYIASIEPNGEVPNNSKFYSGRSETTGY